MTTNGSPTDIVTLFDLPEGAPNTVFYRSIIENTLSPILPQNIQQLAIENPDALDDHRKEFEASLPRVWATSSEKTPATISFFALSKSRANAFKFFFEMISHWLLPGKRLNVVLVYSVDFRIPLFGSELYTLCDVMIHCESESELNEVLESLSILQSEICLGLQSSYHAHRILEIRGLASDVKTGIIQEQISFLISRWPQLFDHNLLSEMQHVLVTSQDEFKAVRDCRHLGRIISAFYRFRKVLRESVKEYPHKRHLELKLFKSTIHKSGVDKSVLSLIVGINFLGDKEVFEERHLISAVQNYIPSARSTEGSFFSNRHGNESVCTFYLDIEKNEGEEFSAEEIRLLRRELPTDLKDRIELFMHPIFMPRNEEEIMRNILTLSNQIKYLYDLPQVIITFDEQTNSHLYFTVIAVEVIKPNSLAVQQVIKKFSAKLEYIHDRSKNMGVIRKKYQKEATVFRVKLPKVPFLRRNHSIDLNKARQTVVNELVEVVGNIRDFNGGMISKQHELLCSLREHLHNHVTYNELLLENFFYSLSPDVMRTVLDPQVLKTLFSLLLESIDQSFFSGENYSLKLRVDHNRVFAMIKADDISLKETLSRSMSNFDFPSSKIASSFVLVYDMSYVGYLYLCDEPEKQQLFCQALQNSILLWDQKKRTSTVR